MIAASPGKQKMTSSMLFADGSLAKAARTSLSRAARIFGRAAAKERVISAADRGFVLAASRASCFSRDVVRRRKRRRAARTAFIGAIEASVRNDLQVKGRRRQFPVALYRY